jgi:hypothetical protein
MIVPTLKIIFPISYVEYFKFVPRNSSDRTQFNDEESQPWYQKNPLTAPDDARTRLPS